MLSSPLVRLLYIRFKEGKVNHLANYGSHVLVLTNSTPPILSRTRGSLPTTGVRPFRVTGVYNEDSSSFPGI